MLRFISSCFILTRVSLFFFLFAFCPPGEICAFNIHGLEAPFEAVVLNGTSGEGQLRARGLVDCELQKEYTFIIQAHDCGSGPGGTEGKKSHKWVRISEGWQDEQSAREVLPHNIKQSGVFAAIQGPDSLVLRRGKQKIKLTSFFIIDIEKKLKINYVPCWVSFFFILFIPHLDNASTVVAGK